MAAGTGQRTMVRRERLLDQLSERFNRRLLLVRAGAGFGKTTLLRQAIDDNTAGDSTGGASGVDVWIDIDHQQTRIGDICSMALKALGVTTPEPSVDHVAAAVLAQAPHEVALVFDNLHRLAHDDDAGVDLAALLDALPANGHMVVASRNDLPFAYRRLLAEGAALVIDEAAMTFSDDELDAFAELRNTTAEHLGEVRWPALLELRADGLYDNARHYVAEEVLGSLEPARLTALQRLALRGRFDDELARHVGGFDGTAGDLVAGLPLVAQSSDGEVVLHDLWREWLPPLSPTEEAATAAELGRRLEAHGQLTEAFAMYSRAGDADPAVRILRAIACDYSTRYGLDQRKDVLALLPAGLADHPAARLIEADLVAITSPTSAELPLTRAEASARNTGDPELAAQAILRQSEILYRTYDSANLQESKRRLAELDDSVLAVRAVDQMLDIWLAMSSNQMAKVSDAVRSADALAYEPTATHALSYHALAIGHGGDIDRSLNELDTLPQLHGRHAAIVSGFRSIMMFLSGRMDRDGLQAARDLIAAIKLSGSTNTIVEGSATVAIYHLAAGDLVTARSLLDDVVDRIPTLAPRSWAGVAFELAEATFSLHDGDEASAQTRIDAALPDGGPFDGIVRHLFHLALVPTYLLVPRARRFFDDDPSGPDFAFGRTVAHALVAIREGEDPAPAAALDWSELARLRTWAPEPFLAELAAAALSYDGDDASGEAISGARAALDSLRGDSHRMLNDLAERHTGALASTASALAAEAPAQPRTSVQIDVLGPTIVTIGDQVTESGAMRRRARELLHLLIDHRKLDRRDVMQTLWPDLDEKKARNNLRVTLSLLNDLLEPDRERGAEPWHVRSDGDRLRLVDSALLHIDVDRFDELLRDAARHERTGRPLDAITAYEQAAELYRGDYLADSPDGDLGFEERTRCRADVVQALTRASTLLAASGEPERAVIHATRAIEIEPLDEAGHLALLDAHARADDAVGYELAASRCRSLFASEGLPPSPNLAKKLDAEAATSTE